MKDLIGLLASAIATQEGFFRAGSLPFRDANPGDIRSAPWLQHPAVIDGFWKAPSVESGIAGLYHQIALDIARGMSLRDLIYTWAPPSDGNKTEVYIHNVMEMTGISSMTVPLQNLLEISPLRQL